MQTSATADKLSNLLLHFKTVSPPRIEPGVEASAWLAAAQKGDTGPQSSNQLEHSYRSLWCQWGRWKNKQGAWFQSNVLPVWCFKSCLCSQLRPPWCLQVSAGRVRTAPIFASLSPLYLPLILRLHFPIKNQTHQHTAVFLGEKKKVVPFLEANTASTRVFSKRLLLQFSQVRGKKPLMAGMCVCAPIIQDGGEVTACTTMDCISLYFSNLSITWR